MQRKLVSIFENAAKILNHRNVPVSGVNGQSRIKDCTKLWCNYSSVEPKLSQTSSLYANANWMANNWFETQVKSQCRIKLKPNCSVDIQVRKMSLGQNKVQMHDSLQ